MKLISRISEVSSDPCTKGSGCKKSPPQTPQLCFLQHSWFILCVRSRRHKCVGERRYDNHKADKRTSPSTSNYSGRTPFTGRGGARRRTPDASGHGYLSKVRSRTANITAPLWGNGNQFPRTQSGAGRSVRGLTTDRLLWAALLSTARRPEAFTVRYEASPLDCQWVERDGLGW